VVHERFLRTLTAHDPDVVEFIDCLREVYEFGKTADLGLAFRSEDSIRRLLAAWSSASRESRDGFGDGRTHTLRPTIADAVNATALLEHLLRPLSIIPRPVALTHSAANGLGALLALTAKWEHDTPFILTEHGVYLRERYLAYRQSNYSRPVKAIVLRFFKLLTDAAYRIADLITPGNAYNQRWALRGGAPAEIIKTVYNGVEPDEFPAAVGEPDVPTISFMGRIDPIKDIETLVRGFGYVHDQMPEARLRIFGGAPKGGEAYFQKCKDLAHSLGLDGSLVFEGRVEHARDAYAAGHVVALTSISEGFPYTVVEAMISGRTTVSTDVGGVSEAVGETGLLVPPRDPRAFGEACLTLLRDDERRRTLAAAARERALEMFTLDTFLGIYRDIYDHVGGAAVAPSTPSADSRRSVTGRATEGSPLERIELPTDTLGIDELDEMAGLAS
jgi:glycosyltransferase involved in cell wall biosynthesis